MQDEYRDVLEQQIAEKRHQPKSRGGLGTTRRNKRTLPGGRGDTDQPRRLTKVRLGRGGGCETKGCCLQGVGMRPLTAAAGNAGS
jgi:hypothetical protein